MYNGKMADNAHINPICTLTLYIKIKNERCVNVHHIVNSFGLLSSFFKYAKSVFVGKSTLKKLGKVGGQNPIEAAKFGCRIYHGPYVYNFREIYEILEKNRISKKINEEEELSKNLSIDLENFENKNNENSLLIKNLGKQTLSNTILDIKNFLKNDVQ